MLLKNKISHFSPIFLVLLSALLYPIPFYFPELFFWISFIYPVPVFYAAVQYGLDWRYGLLWGLVALSLHEIAVYEGLFYMAQGALYLKTALIVFMIFYRALYAAIWFLVAQFLQQRLRVKVSCAVPIGLWVVTTWVFQLCMERLHLWPLGTLEGSLFFSPLIPLAFYPPLLGLLPVMGEGLLLLGLFATAGCITYILICRQTPWLLLTFLASVWSYGFLCEKKDAAPVWISCIGIIQENFVTRANKLAILQLHEACGALVHKNPLITCILCPESCLYDADFALSLATYREQLPTFNALQIIVGGFCQDAQMQAQKAQRNTAYFCHYNTQLMQYDKRHALPFTERVPRLFHTESIKNLFFAQRLPIVASQNSRPLWHIASNPVVPYICSELFFNVQPDDDYHQVTILALCNDAWVNRSGRKIMLLAARFRAISWQRDLLYVSYGNGFHMSKNGNLSPLLSLK